MTKYGQFYNRKQYLLFSNWTRFSWCVFSYHIDVLFSFFKASYQSFLLNLQLLIDKFLLNSSFITIHSSDSFTLSVFLFSSCSAMARIWLGRPVLLFGRTLVCYTAVFSVVTQRCGEERCVTTLKTAVWETCRTLTLIWQLYAIYGAVIYIAQFSRWCWQCLRAHNPFLFNIFWARSWSFFTMWGLFLHARQDPVSDMCFIYATFSGCLRTAMRTSIETDRSGINYKEKWRRRRGWWKRGKGTPDI